MSHDYTTRIQGMRRILSVETMAGGGPMTIVARGVVARAARSPLTVEEIRVDPPGPGEALIRLLACGVCHSDLLASQGVRFRGFPFLLGHEGAGVVEAVGPGVESPSVGDVVILAWRAPCGRCRHCRAARSHLCVDTRRAGPRMHTMDEQALTPVLGIGAFCTHTVVAAAQATVVPADLPPASLCLIGCAVMTGVGAVLHSARVSQGASVAVFGCGGVGTSVIQGARLAHARATIAVDIEDRKLAWAAELGATHTVNARQGDPVARVRDLAGGHGVDYAFEAVGRPETLAQAFACLDRGGTCTLLGVPADEAVLPLGLAGFFEVGGALRGSRYGDCVPSRDFPLMVDLYRRGALKLDELVSETIDLADVPAAFARMERGETLRSVVLFPSG
jgi:S-(hydroxymethyl)mycothiol dehydrogenase